MDEQLTVALSDIANDQLAELTGEILGDIDEAVDEALVLSDSLRPALGVANERVDPTAERTIEGVLHIGLLRKRQLLTVEDSTDVGQFVTQTDKGHELSAGGVSDGVGDSRNEQLIVVDVLDDLGSVLPSTRSREGVLRIVLVGGAKHAGVIHDERQNHGGQSMRGAPLQPDIVIDIDGSVHEPILKRARHGKGNATVFLSVTSSDDAPARRQFILTDGLVENELIRCGLNGGVSGVQLVQHQIPTVGVFAGLRKKSRGIPDDQLGLVVDNRQTTEVCGVEGGQADILKADSVFDGELLNALRLTDTGTTPKEHRNGSGKSAHQLFDLGNIH